MGVQLNIKDVGTVELARSLAQRLGKSVTETVREALEEKSRDADRTARKARIMAISREAANHWLPETAGMTSQEMVDALYDDDGLPV